MNYNKYMISIPKTIHQIWLGPKKRPDIWMDTWKHKYCTKYPEWTYKLWTEDEIDDLELINQQQYDYETYYNAKSDIARYEILSRFGGIFMDADSMYLDNQTTDKSNNLDWIIEVANKNGGFFAATEPKNTNIYANGVIGSIPNHPIMNQMIEYIANNYYRLKSGKPKERDIWTITGTLPFTEIVNNNKTTLFSLNHRYFYPVSFHQNNLELTKDKIINEFPEAIMMQYGYTSNNILHDNCMEKFVNST